MATESQKQIKLIESGLLDNLGSNKSALEFDNVEAVFVKYMGQLVEALQENLNKEKSLGGNLSSSSVATGALSASIRFEYKKLGQSYIGEVYMLDYGDYIDQGVKGIDGPKPSNKNSPYQFKYLFPSKDMQASLLVWIRAKNIFDKWASPIGLFGKKTKSMLSTKAKRNGLAIAIGKSIKKKGIDGTHFKSISVDSILADLNRDLAKAAAKDVAISIRTATLN